MRFLPRPKSTKTSMLSSRTGVFLISGVSVSIAFVTGAAAETMSDTGEVTVFFSPASVQLVRMESESLPTGIEMPKPMQNSLAAFTASKRRASSPGAPQAAIQLAESFTRASSISAAAMFVTASPIAMRLAAAELITAKGVRSPTAMASPR